MSILLIHAYYGVEVRLFLSYCLHYLLLMKLKLFLWLFFLYFLRWFPINVVINISKFVLFRVKFIKFVWFLFYYILLLLLLILTNNIKLPFISFFLFLHIFLSKLTTLYRMLYFLRFELNTLWILIFISVKF